MRVNRLLFLGLSIVLGLQACSKVGAPPGTLPKHKAGLWQQTQTMVSPGQTIKIGTETINMPGQNINIDVKVCVGKDSGKSNDPGLAAIGKELSKSCTKPETHFAGSTMTTDTVCDVAQGMKTRSHTVVTYEGDTAYKIETQAHTDLPPRGGTDTTTTRTEKWLSSTCPTDMEPGDVMDSSGRIISVKAATQPPLEPCEVLPESTVSRLLGKSFTAKKGPVPAVMGTDCMYTDSSRAEVWFRLASYGTEKDAMRTFNFFKSGDIETAADLGDEAFFDFQDGLYVRKGRTWFFVMGPERPQVIELAKAIMSKL